MTYEEFINNILETRGRNGCGEEYHERHHIVPKCMGGSNDKDNLIDLFAREHFEAHRLLALENPDVQGLVYALWRMCHIPGSSKRRNEITSEEYEEARNKNNEALKGKNHPQYGTHRSEETKLKISNARKGKCLSDETKKKLGKLHKKENLSEDTLKKMRESHIGKKQSEETVKKRANAIRGRKRDLSYLEEINRKAIYCVEINKIYNSGVHAYKDTGISRSNISNSCSGKRETAGGYHWKYVYDQINKDGTVIQGAITLGLITEEEVLKILEENKNTNGES